MLSLNNREIATIAWIATGVTLLYLKTDLRKSIQRVLSAVIHPKLIATFLLAATWTIIEVSSIYFLGIWQPEHVKITVFWFVGGACFSILQFERIAKQPDYFRKAIKNSLSWVAIVEVIANLHSFNLFIEVILVPILFLLAFAQEASKTDKDKDRIGFFVNTLLAAIGLSLIINSLRLIVFDYKSLLNASAFAEIVIPSMLTTGFLPFLFAFHIWISYESAFISLQRIVKDKNLLPYARWRAILSFRHRTKFLSRWQNQLANSQPSSKEELRSVIETVLKADRIANGSKHTLAPTGWPPNKATKFLAIHGLTQDFYHPVCDGSWMATSNYKTTNGDILSNSISYFSIGTEQAIHEVKLQLVINDVDNSREAFREFINLSKILYWKAVGSRIRISLEHSLSNCDEFEALEGDCLIALKKHSWKLKSTEGFDLSLTIKNPINGQQAAAEGRQPERETAGEGQSCTLAMLQLTGSRFDALP